jgi:uncharacterized membrane protein
MNWATDLLAVLVSIALLAGYELFLRRKLKDNPMYAIQAVNARARAAWAEGIMQGEGKEVLAVQTLRNSIMGPTFLASTAVLLILGVLSLSGQSEKFNEVWGAFNVFEQGRKLWLAKLLLLALDYFVAFFCFSSAVRLFIHVGFMINVPKSHHGTITPRTVAAFLNRAGFYHTLGMRAYYYSVPLVFWLFGPHFLLLSTVILVAVMFHLDREPKVPA